MQTISSCITLMTDLGRLKRQIKVKEKHLTQTTSINNLYIYIYIYIHVYQKHFTDNIPAEIHLYEHTSSNTDKQERVCYELDSI